MGVPVLIIGKSGSGKSTALRKFKDGKVGVIKVLNKPLPFKAEFKGIMQTDNYEQIKDVLLKAAAPTIVIDDAGYLLTNTFMRGHHSSKNTFDFYNDMADMFWQMIDVIMTLPAGKIVYVVMHEEETESGNIKPKTLGRLLDNTVCVEGLFSIVLRAMFIEKRFVFATQTDGKDVAKSPIGMFEPLIDNDLSFVDNRIREYYGI
jgi:hypothetical protein